MDDNILIADRNYGHALFEEELHKILGEKSMKSKNIDRAEIMFTKCNIAKSKREQQKKTGWGGGINNFFLSFISN